MKRRAFSLLLALGLLCSLFPAASAEEGSPSAVTALCVAEPGQSVFLDEKEFQLLCRQSTGHDLESVTFSLLSAGVGKLTCRGERVTAEDAYYMYRSPAISDVCFTPYAYSSASRFVGQAELAFTMTSDKEETVFGRLILYVPETPAAPAEERSLMDKTLAAKAGEPVELVIDPNIVTATKADVEGLRKEMLERGRVRIGTRAAAFEKNEIRFLVDRMPY